VQAHQKHTYRLVLRDDGRGCAREVEFEEISADAAVHLAQQVCKEREMEIFENDRLLGRLKRAPKGRLWVVSA
jgi:hypothetical protein